VGSSKSVINLYDLKMLDDNDDADPHGQQGGGSGIQHYDTGHRLPAISSIVAQRLHRESLATHRHAAVSPTQPALHFGISSIDWYPVDGGLLVTGSFDGLVRVWDANVFSVEAEFALKSKVFAAHFSPISTTHSLIAAATANREVRLCDMATESSLHSLLGHQDEIWSLAWSPANEFHLATGSRNGEIRLWDIRRSGATACLLCLNHEGPADVPGRSSLYTNVKKLPSTSLVMASKSTVPLSRKRRRGDEEGEKSEAKRRRRGDDEEERSQSKKAVGRSDRVRSDPNFAASVSLARAHAKGINSLAYTPDGRFLLTSAHDHLLRVWDARSGEHLFVKYEGTQNAQIPRQVQMAVVQEGDAQRGTMVFHPNGNDGELTSYRVHHSGDADAGAALTRSTAHYKPIVSCVYRPSRRELLTGAADGLIMKWLPKPIQWESHTEDRADVAGGALKEDQDAWSDDEDEEADAGGGGARDLRFVPPILRQEFMY
jgi:DNA excision repair protein ERCC-8